MFITWLFSVIKPNDQWFFLAFTFMFFFGPAAQNSQKNWSEWMHIQTQPYITYMSHIHTIQTASNEPTWTNCINVAKYDKSHSRCRLKTESLLSWADERQTSSRLFLLGVLVTRLSCITSQQLWTKLTYGGKYNNASHNEFNYN